MFGTNRKINKFDLCILKDEENNGQKKCHIGGVVSYTVEVDFMNETVDDAVIIYLYFSSQQFNKLAKLIKSQGVDILEVRLSQVSGFYSEWSPSINTNNIKILGDPESQKIIMQDGCEIDPPRLGDVDEFNMTITQRHKLNLKQDLRSVSLDKLFEGSDNYEEEFLEKKKCQNSQRDQDSLILSQLVCNEATFRKLRRPIWLIFIGLCVLLIKFIFW